MTLHGMLKEKFGFDSFRTGQEAVIRSVLSGKDTIAILPTGTGKSLCYQLPGYMLDGPVLIISPLVSLMEDQAASMRRNGEKRVVALNSFLQYEAKSRILSSLHMYRFIFISPEMLAQEKVARKLKGLSLSLLVVDEAHCISEWGFDFRPDYLRIGEFLKGSRPPVLALTATANEKVLNDIKDYLSLVSPIVERQSLDRPNIAYSIERVESENAKTDWIEKRLTDTTGPGIIYVSSRKRADGLAAVLSGKGISVQSYHAGKEQEDRALLQEQFIRGEIEWICATNAFGMGIHKDDIRQVIHEHMPSSISSYVQEVGRAGRDGEPAIAVLLYAEEDEQMTRFIIQSDLPAPESIFQYDKNLREGISMVDAAALSGLSETSKRIIDYYRRQMAPDEIVKRLEQLSAEKNQELARMTSLIRTDRCLRQEILALFGEIHAKGQQDCCSNCGLGEMPWLEKGRLAEAPPHSINWEKRLGILLG